MKPGGHAHSFARRLFAMGLLVASRVPKGRPITVRVDGEGEFRNRSRLRVIAVGCRLRAAAVPRGQRVVHLAWQPQPRAVGVLGLGGRRSPTVRASGGGGRNAGHENDDLSRCVSAAIRTRRDDATCVDLSQARTRARSRSTSTGRPSAIAASRAALRRARASIVSIVTRWPIVGGGQPARGTGRFRRACSRQGGGGRGPRACRLGGDLGGMRREYDNQPLPERRGVAAARRGRGRGGRPTRGATAADAAPASAALYSGFRFVSSQSTKTARRRQSFLTRNELETTIE